jgi:hypothetical protein
MFFVVVTIKVNRYYSFYDPFCRTCLVYSTRRRAPRALKNACDKMVSYKTRIINNYTVLNLNSKMTSGPTFLHFNSLYTC